MNEKLKAIIAIIIVVGLCFFLICLVQAQTGLATMDNDTIVGWKIECWQITDTWDQPITVNEGQALDVSFDQPLTGNNPNQVTNPIGTTTGLSVSKIINYQDVTTTTTDGIATVHADITMFLTPTKWSMVIYAEDKAGNWSNNSIAFWFIVAKPIDHIPASIPVNVKVTIQQ